MEGTRKRPWSDLPPEILSMIGSWLHTRVDVLRFRSVCSSFRSSIPPLRSDVLRFPFRVPCARGYPLFLCESTVYTVETPDRAAASRRRWLLKLEESELGDMRNLSIFSRRPTTSLPRKFPEVLDSLQFRIVEICREYILEFGGGGTNGFNQAAMVSVVVHPDCVWTDVDQCSVYYIDRKGHLGYWKYGDENLTPLDDAQGWGYDDIVVYEGKVCVVDQSGSVSQIDSSLRLRSFSLPIDGRTPGKKHLVVSSGDLYVVNRYSPPCGMTWDFSAYRLDRQCGRWEEVRSLGNSAFFLCNHCSFAVPASELDGCIGDCIYYAARYQPLYFRREEVTVFNLADPIHYHEWPDFSGFISLVKHGDEDYICGRHLCL